MNCLNFSPLPLHIPFYEFRIGLMQSLEAILLNWQFLRELVASVHRAVQHVLLFVEFGSSLEDFVDFISNLLAGVILGDGGIALGPLAVNGDITQVNHASFSTLIQNLRKQVWKRPMMVLPEGICLAEGLTYRYGDASTA